MKNIFTLQINNRNIKPGSHQNTFFRNTFKDGGTTIQKTKLKWMDSLREFNCSNMMNTLREMDFSDHDTKRLQMIQELYNEDKNELGTFVEDWSPELFQQRGQKYLNVVSPHLNVSIYTNEIVRQAICLSEAVVNKNLDQFLYSIFLTRAYNAAVNTSDVWEFTPFMKDFLNSKMGSIMRTTDTYGVIEFLYPIDGQHVFALSDLNDFNKLIEVLDIKGTAHNNIGVQGVLQKCLDTMIPLAYLIGARGHTSAEIKYYREILSNMILNKDQVFVNNAPIKIKKIASTTPLLQSFVAENKQRINPYSIRFTKTVYDVNDLQDRLAKLLMSLNSV